MIQEGEIMDCDNFAQLFTDRGQGEIRTVVDIDLDREIVRVERQTPAIPDNIQVAVRDKNTASPYVLRIRKRTLPCGASAGEQGILIAGILGQHGIDQSTYIVTYARALANGRRIVNGDMHEKILLLLAWRPSKFAPSQQVQVQMKDRLPSIRADISN